MKIIGQGVQYKVVDSLDGRVIKIPLTRQQSRAIVAGWHKSHKAPLARILIEHCAEQIIIHWQYGFSEIVWNPLTNNGIDAKGNIVLLDLGEITFDKTVVAKQITAKSWLKTWAHTKGLPDGLKAHYRIVMENTLTFLNLKKWSELTQK